MPQGDHFHCLIDSSNNQAIVQGSLVGALGLFGGRLPKRKTKYYAWYWKVICYFCIIMYGSLIMLRCKAIFVMVWCVQFKKWLGHHWHLNPSPWQVQMLSQLLFCFVANSLTDLKRRVLFSYWCSLTITLCVFYYHNYHNQWHILWQHPLMSGKQQLKRLFMVYTAWQLYSIHIHTLRNLGVNSWEGRLNFHICATKDYRKGFWSRISVVLFCLLIKKVTKKSANALSTEDSIA